MGKSSKEKRFRLKQRSNSLFDHEGVNKEGRKYYRRISLGTGERLKTTLKERC